MADPGLASRNLWTLTVVKKQLVGITGLLLIGFLLGHVTGNFLIFVGPEAYNKYGHAMVTNPIYPVIAYGLIALFVVHALFALLLAYLNKGAKSVGYAVSPAGPKGTGILHRSLPIQGVLIVAFIILHLLSFKYGEMIMVEYDGVQMRDLFTLIVSSFKNPLFTAWYVLCLLILAMHLAHGFSSSFQTLGLSHPKYKKRIDKSSKFVALYISLGFIAQPLYIYFFYKG